MKAVVLYRHLIVTTLVSSIGLFSAFCLGSKTIDILRKGPGSIRGKIWTASRAWLDVDKSVSVNKKCFLEFSDKKNVA